MTDRILKPDDRVPRLALRPAEAADAIGISERTLRSWLRERQIPHVRIGNLTLFPIDALRGWLAAEAAKENCKQTAATT